MFDSGPHVSCYRATSLDTGVFTGVRCIKFANFIHCPETTGIAFVWYAEGDEPAGPYRHFGEAFITESAEVPATLIAHAAGIVGNGERAEPFLRLRFELPQRSTGVPARLLVTGDRQEQWTLVPDGLVPDYQPLRRHIERTGPQFDEFTVRKNDGAPGFGVRGMLTGGSWIGAGRWRDVTYLHLGTHIGTQAGALRIGASDIAVGNGFCGFVPWGELTIRADADQGPALRHVTGAWSETWQQRVRHDRLMSRS